MSQIYHIVMSRVQYTCLTPKHRLCGDLRQYLYSNHQDSVRIFPALLKSHKSTFFALSEVLKWNGVQPSFSSPDCFHVSPVQSRPGWPQDKLRMFWAGWNVLDTLRVITEKWKIPPQPTASLPTFYIFFQFCVKFIHFSLREWERLHKSKI